MISIPENAASFNEEYSNYKMSNLEKAKAFQDKSKNKKTLAQAMFERRKVERPSIEELNKMLWEMPTTKIAKLYGVSDKAIEKWAKGYELTKPPPGYWQKLAAGKIINNEQI
jgi:DNA-binding transcriptional regulator YiaG